MQVRKKTKFNHKWKDLEFCYFWKYNQLIEISFSFSFFQNALYSPKSILFQQFSFDWSYIIRTVFLTNVCKYIRTALCILLFLIKK